jgi:hypothetical protein
MMAKAMPWHLLSDASHIFAINYKFIFGFLGQMAATPTAKTLSPSLSFFNN